MDRDERFFQWLDCFGFIFDVSVDQIVADFNALTSIVNTSYDTVQDVLNYKNFEIRNVSQKTCQASRNRLKQPLPDAA